MALWYPPEGQPHLLDWWRPAIIASRTLRERRYGWLIHVDELMLMGRIDRSRRPSIWVYKHKESRRELYLDTTGQAYKYTVTPNARSHGRFSRCPLEVAVWRADLPAFVTPTFYEQPPPRAADLLAADEGADEGDHAPDATPRPPRRRGHLTVIDGGRGRPLAG